MKSLLGLILVIELVASFAKCDIVYSDNVSGIEYGEILMKKFSGEAEIQSSDYIRSYIFNFNNPSSLGSKPSVLIGMSIYDNFYKQYFINFKMQKIKTTSTQFEMQLTVFKGSCLYGVSFNYLAIDTSKFTNFFISDIIEQQVQMQLTGNYYQSEFYVKFQKASIAPNQKKVQAFLTGFRTKQESSSYDMDNFSISLKVISQDDNGFTIRISQKEKSLIVDSINFNYIEIDEDPYSIIETNILNYNQYEDSSTTKCLYDKNSHLDPICKMKQGSTEFERYTKSTVTLPHTFTQQNVSVINLFVGLNAATIITDLVGNPLTDFNPRIKLLNKNIENNQNLSFEYYVWYYTQISSIVSNGIIILSKSCSGSDEILNKNICISSSTSCDAGTILLNGVCTQCSAYCSSCMTSTSNCLSCQDDKYLMPTNICENTQPVGYFCSKQNKDTYFTCTQCADTNCDLCSSNIQSTCTKCKAGYYIFKGQCYATKPSSAYCDTTTFVCQACVNTLCQVCLSSLSQCQTCLPQKYILEQECYENQPEQSSCDQYTCNMSGTCKTRDSNNKCTECVSENYFYKNICYLTKPLNTCCGSTNICVDTSIANCQDCTTIQFVNTCNLCKTGYYLYDNKCTQSQPSSTYCNAQSICSKCPDSLNNCKYCSDPSKNPYCIQCIDSSFVLDAGSCSTASSDSSRCHYSCNQCFGTSYNQCIYCSSGTRQFDATSNICPCKTGFTDVTSSSECWEDDLEPNYIVKQLGTYGLQIYLIVSLPLVIINFHPFTDAYMFPLQLIGNFAIVSSQVRKLLGNFVIFNYLNINYNKDNSQNEQEKAELFKFIEFNTNYHTQVVDDLLLFAVFFFSIILISIILKLTARNNQDYQQSRTYLYFFWNIFIKSFRIFSNYLLIQIFGRIFSPSLLSSQSPISIIIFVFIIIFLFISIFCGYLFVLRKESYSELKNQHSYLNRNLIIENNLFHKHFWLILELRKILVAIFLCSLDLKISIFFVLTFSFALLLIFLNCKPYRANKRDSVYLIINEMVIIVFSIVTLTYVFRSTEQQQSFINYQNAIFVLSFIFICFHLFINFEYVIRRLIYNKKLSDQEKKLNKSPDQQTFDVSVEDFGNKSWVQHKFQRSTLISTPKKHSLN